MPPESDRLPCRGCTRDCPNYDSCEGRPWRLREQLLHSLSWAGLNAAGSSALKSAESRDT